MSKSMEKRLEVQLLTEEICGNCGGNGERWVGKTCVFCKGEGVLYFDDEGQEIEDYDPRDDWFPGDDDFPE